jgi:hypothetical protein
MSVSNFHATQTTIVPVCSLIVVHELQILTLIVKKLHERLLPLALLTQ